MAARAGDGGAGSIRSTGWLVGPYVVARPNGGNLILSGSFLAGRSDLSISPLGTFTDDITSNRRLATFSVAHEVDMGNTTLLPRIDISHVVEDRPAYTDGLGGSVAAGSLALTEASIGLDFQTTIPVSDGSSRLTGGVSAIWSRTDQDGVVESDGRARVSLGWSRQYDHGLSLSLDASYDGIGAKDLGSLGVDFRMGLTF